MTDLTRSQGDTPRGQSRSWGDVPFALLLGVRLAGATEGTETRATLLAGALLAAIRTIAAANPHAPLARLAVQEHVGDADGHLARQPAALHGLARLPLLQVLVHPVDALDHHLALLGEDAQDT